MNHFADRLIESVADAGTPLCVGIDPRWDSLPRQVRSRYEDSPAGKAQAFTEFGIRILDLVAGQVAIVKVQSAFFESCGPAGFESQLKILNHARQLGLLTILDAKRGDIASTASAYADAAFDIWKADALTVNPYLGQDAVEPFIAKALSRQAGIFVLVRTSNPGASLFQDLVCSDEPLFMHVGRAVQGWNDGVWGDSGYGAIGAVVGATNIAELRALRTQFPKLWFLVPGFGAQGGSANDVAASFNADGFGAIVNSSRGITFPFHPDDPHWEVAVTNALAAAIAAINAVRLA